MTLEPFLDYSDWCRARLKGFLLTCPDVFETRFETSAAYDSIAKLLAHSIGAEERWQRRLTDEPTISYYESKKKLTIETLFADADQVRARSRAILGTCADDGLARRLTYKFGSFHGDMSWEETFFHVLHHETWHRGQVVSQLQRLGLDPPDFDYCYFREKTP